MKNLKNQTLYQQLQQSDKKYLKIKKTLDWQPVGFSSVRKNTICQFSKRSSGKLELGKRTRIKNRVTLSIPKFLISEKLLQKKTKVAASIEFWPSISNPLKIESKNSKRSFPCFCVAKQGKSCKKREAFSKKNKITFRDYLKTRLVLNYCLSPQQMENQNFFISQRLKIKSTPSWKKSVATIYYLLIAYKKTMRVKLNYYFNNSTNLQFFLAISPFLGYFLQTSIEKYELKYQQSTFFSKSLPGLKKPIQVINWETYAYTKYSTKLNARFITQVNSADDCFFISLNPHWQFKQKQLSTATFELLPYGSTKKQGVSTSATKWSFLPSRYFYNLLHENEKQGFNETILGQSGNGFFVGPGFLTAAQKEQNESNKIQNPSKAEINSTTKMKGEEQKLKKSSLGFQTKFTKASSEIRFWKNFKSKFSETNPNLNFFPVVENQSAHLHSQTADQPSQSFEKSEKEKTKLQNPFPQFSRRFKPTVNFQSLNSYQTSLKKQIILNSDWQIFFNELDDIPTKLNSIFQDDSALLKKTNQSLKSPLIFSFSDLDLNFPSIHLSPFESSLQNVVAKEENVITYLDDGYAGTKNKFSFTDFKESFTHLESNYKKSNLKFIDYSQKFNSNTSSFKSKSNLFSNELSLKKNLTQNSSFALQKESEVSFKFNTKKLLLNSNLLNKKLFLLKKIDLIGIETIQFDSFKKSDQTWIHLLTKIFNRPFLKKEPPLFLDRNLQYNLDFGFSQLGKLIKLNILRPNLENRSLAFGPQSKVEKNKSTSLSETSAVFKNFENGDSQLKVDLLNNLGGVSAILANEIVEGTLRSEASSFEILPKSVSLILQKAIREDLRSPLPSWILEAQNQTFPSGKSAHRCSQTAAKAKELKIRIGTYPFLLKLTNYEIFVLKQFKFDNVVTNSLLKRPYSILGLLKKSEIGFNFADQQSKGQKFDEKKTFGLKLNELREDKKNFSLLQRKVSGYLYPDSLRNTILTNTSFFNFNKSSKNLNFCLAFLRKSKGGNSAIKKYEQEFTQIISPSLLNQEKNIEGSRSSLIQVYQPLIQNSIDAYSTNFLNNYFCNLIQNSKSAHLHSQTAVKSFIFDRNLESSFLSSQTPARVEKPGESILNFYKLQRGSDYLNCIEPDQPFTAKKEFFFGVPTVSPLYGITLKEYKEKFEKRKKDIQKNHLISPYENSLNFIIQSNSNLKQSNPHSIQNFFGDGGTRTKDLYPENSLKLDTKSILNEITKGATFSNTFLEKITPFSPFKSSLIKQSIQNLESDTNLNYSFNFQKNEKFFNLEQRAIPYKTHFNYTKLRVLSRNLNKLEKSLIRSTFSANLYEPITLKTWTLSSQLGFAFIVLKLASILYNEYREEMGYYINEFAVFFNEYEKNNFLDFLDFFNPKENFRVINKTNKKFSDLVGGRFLLTEFGEVILLLRNSRKIFYRIGISKPKRVSFDKTSSFSKIVEPFFLSGKQKGRKPTFPSGNAKGLDPLFFILAPFVGSSKSTLLRSQMAVMIKKLKFREFFIEKPHLKLENFIPKGILLIGPPGTGKTLLVKALSGEASVPVIVESGKMLTTNLENNGAERLKDLFKAAREMSPCILFLDEVDTIGQKRENVLSTFASGEKENQIPNTLNFIYLENRLAEKLNSPISENFSDFNSEILNPLLKLQISKNSITKKNQELNDLKTQITNQKISSGKQKYQDLIMLTQLLCELDGLNKRQEIIVIGATNRPATLDSALTRPGRFGKVIYLDLPGKQKRFELLKFYSHSKKESLFNQQRFEFGLFIPTFSSFFSSESESNTKVSSHSSDLNFILGRNFSKSDKFLKTVFSKIQNFVLPLPSLDLLKPSLSASSKIKGQPSLKTNNNLGVDENLNWNYFANQTVGLSAAHLASAMNRSALKAIFIYLFQTQKETKVFNSSFLQKNSQNRLKKARLENEVKQTSLNTNSDLLFHLIKMSKKLKLRVVAQSGLGKNEILNQLNLVSKKDSAHKVTKHQPLHNFETVEYGIQTISTMNTSLQLKVTKGKKVNKKIIGQFTRDDFFLKLISPSGVSGQNEKISKTSENFTVHFPKKILTQFWSPKESQNSTSGEMQSFVKGNKSLEKRNLFYQKHRQYLRTLAFLGGSENRISNKVPNLKKNGVLAPSVNLREQVLSSKARQKLKKNIGYNAKNQVSFKIANLISLTLAQLKILSRYLNRIIQNQSLGWILLFNSTCLIQNSFFLFSLQNQNQKNLNFIYYNLLFLNFADKQRKGKKGNTKKNFGTLLKWQNFTLLNQTSLFGDSLFINRSAYYLSGKALIHVASRVEKRIDEPISLWSFSGSVQTRQKKSSDPSFGVATQGKSSKLFLTKIQFENFILSLIAGKAAEKLMLANQLGIQKKNDSNIGIMELKELGLLIKLMGEKYLFYSEKQFNHKQININLLENKKQINQDEFLFLKELSTLFENQNKALTHLPSNPLRSYDQFQSIDQPWWQLKSINLLASFNLKYGEWYRLFLAEEQQNFRNIEWIAPDTYFHNQVNNSSLIFNKTNLLSQNHDKNTYFVNRAFIFKYLQFSKLNWNQLQLLESESIASYFLFESFNKSCNLLDKNREVIDSLVYSLICHESLRDFEILNNYRRYFK
uniref:Cell division protein n=1 Tax=Tupiella akineta TaxID=160070 RepID=Q3ZJ75_TUPAK|nr:cell division protein [Tupiella akineta]AAV80616.1 cell division protein [Tupiella akineta]